MSACDKCKKESAVLIRYSGAHLCEEHFCEFVERRVKHELRKQIELKGGERIAVAVSGGKDSTLVLHLIHAILGKRRDLEIAAITVDEGIAGYRESSIPMVAENCRERGIEHIVVSLKDMFGTTMDEIASAERRVSTCSFCGVLRRVAMNRTAREWKATHLATGLNLDDTAQSVLMNFARGDLERLARLGPHQRVQEGLVPRIQPLRMIPESETTLYAIIKGLKFHDLECPYAPEALRNTYRQAVAQLEDASPGTRHSIIKSYDQILPALMTMFEPAKLRACSCGEPTISEKCKACEMIEALKRR
ncbi:MAG: TIGR00269 family protein [Thermoplasmata archaeon]|nr:TIGR00269 family protein [Thermoplasmata archaeon]